jgi:L-ascorbate metabolism protein UlaG (beta-lactamase superfamily)
MNIQYYGHSCFKITTKPTGRGGDDVIIFLDPFDKSIGLRPPQGIADLVLVSHDHKDHNNIQAIKGNPQIVNIPGEYSIKGVSITGISSYHDEKEGMERGLNTIYILESEELKICHLGDLGCDLNEKQLEKISGSDIVMIPIGGKYTIGAKKAVALIKKIEPAIIIPMHYKVNGLTVDIADEKEFCILMGDCPKEKNNKITLKKKDLVDKKMEIVLMQAN